MEDKPHIFIGSNAEPYRYVTHGKAFSENTPARARFTHGERVLSQYRAMKAQTDAISELSIGMELESPLTVNLTFESFPHVDLLVDRLTDLRAGIEVSNVSVVDNITFATVMLPLDKFEVLEKKFLDYLDPQRDSRGSKRPRNADLVDAISRVQTAVFENLWTDFDDIPDPSATLWLEIWLPVGKSRVDNLNDFRTVCDASGFHVSNSVLEFPERTVVLVQASIDQLKNNSLILSRITEIRKSRVTAEFFDSLGHHDQVEWVDDLSSRVVDSSGSNSPKIAILDTGVGYGHPLVAPFMNESDAVAFDSDWDVGDEDGHGTGMAGLALYGDLTDVLANDDEVEIKHRVESVKLIRKPGDNEGRHLGQVTSDGISALEIQSPDGDRVYAMALSSTETRDRGRPSSWSSEIDALASDALKVGKTRLFVVCAGNEATDLTGLRDYPIFNLTRQLHDPAQAWNALSVGAYTSKVDITDDGAQDYEPLAPAGGLSPFSSTSTEWWADMPLKPDVVFEGGNMGVDSSCALEFHSLKPLTSYHEITQRLLTTFSGTSAATALASNFLALLMVQYPGYRPETYRALMVHSAEWTDAMKEQFNFTGQTESENFKNLLRIVGHGVPNLRKALWSASNSLSLIVEDSIRPYMKKRSDIATKDMNIHRLPWPEEALLSLGETEVKMTVTLSYFVEPNPSSQVVAGKYRYPSCQLRFDLKRSATETIGQFAARLSRAQEKESDNVGAVGRWMFGKTRTRGSIHKDVWVGSAADLAGSGVLAVFPVTGWWRTRKALGKYDEDCPYSLVVTIETPSVGTDIYTPVDQQVNAMVEV